MLSLRASRLLRAAGYVLLLCLGFLAAETVVADVCDGDGGARVAHVEGATHLAVASADDGAHDAPNGPAGPAQHSTHVDHCAHPHGGAVVATLARRATDHARPDAVRAESERRPPSVTLEPSDRPPAS